MSRRIRVGPLTFDPILLPLLVLGCLTIGWQATLVVWAVLWIAAEALSSI